ncbi:hypothetical protein Hanom_Chr10g00957071 [Helianthus anomalus]
MNGSSIFQGVWSPPEKYTNFFFKGCARPLWGSPRPAHDCIVVIGQCIIMLEIIIIYLEGVWDYVLK